MKANLIGAGAKQNRKELDFYPTPYEVTFALLNFLKLSPCIIREVCCGTGEISRILSMHGHKVISTDIRFTGFGQGGC